jgi:hypothetical protein
LAGALAAPLAEQPAVPLGGLLAALLLRRTESGRRTPNTPDARNGNEVSPA